MTRSPPIAVWGTGRVLRLLTRIAADLPERMPDYGLITLQGEPPSPAALAFRDVIRVLAGGEPETA